MIKHTCLAYLPVLAYEWIHKIKTACFLPTSDAIQHIYNIPHGTNSVESQNHFFHLKTWNVFPLCKIAPSRLVMFFFHYCLNLTPKVIVINLIFLLRHVFFFFWVWWQNLVKHKVFTQPYIEPMSNSSMWHSLVEH